MDLIDREELLINCQEAMFLKDLTLEQRAHIIMEHLDNAPTVDAVPMSVIEEIKAEIKALPWHASKSNPYLAVYVDVYEVLKIINEYKAESED